MDGIPDSVSAPQQPNTAAAQTPVPSSIAAPDSPNPGMSSPMPNLGSGPAPNVVPAPAAAPQQPTPQQLADHHTSLMGKAAQFLLGNQNTYSVDPTTGKTVATPVPQQPGQLFRSILAGAIMGGAVGAQNTSGNGLQSAATAAGAVQQQQQAQDAAKKAQAQQDFKNAQQIDKVQQAKILQAAQIAHMTVQDVVSQQNLDLASQEHLDERNKTSQMMQDNLNKVEGVSQPPVVVDGENINAQQGNGYKLMDMYNKGQIKPADGFHLVPVSTVDYTGLHKDSKTDQWVDSDDKPVDMTHHTTVTINQIPDTSFNNSMVTPGAAAVNAALGTNAYPAGSNPTMTVGNWQNLLATQQDREFKKETQRQQASRVAAENAVAGSEISKNRAEANKANTETRMMGAAGADSDDEVVKGMLSPIPTVDIYSDSSLRGNRREQLIRQAKAIDPNFSELKYKNTIQLVKDSTTGKDAQSIQSFDQYLGHAADLSQAVQGLRNYSIPLVNTPINKLKAMTGNAAATSILIPIDATRTEFQNFLNNNHALQASDKAEADRILNTDMSPAQFEGNVKQFTHTALIRMAAVNNKFRDVTGVNNPNILSPDARENINNLGLGSTASHLLHDEIDPRAAAQLKDGQQTQFANGQVWTSTNGQPWRVK